MRPKYVYQALYGHLIEVKIMEKLLVGTAKRIAAAT